MEISFKIKLIFIIVYFIFVICIERLYVNKLFNKSLDIIPDFQKSSKSFDSFWTFITFFGTKGAFGPIFIILFFFIPLNKVFALTFLILLTGFMDHTLKVVYLQERPIWMNDKIDTGNRHSCGYGNPSGHSLSSTCLYLSLWYTLAEIIDSKVINKKIAKILKYIILAFCILLFLTIMTSRLYLGVHSLNQIIFGCSIGLGIFLLFMPILQIYQSSGSEFLQKQYYHRFKHFICILFGILFFYSFYFARKDILGIDKKKNWQKMCLDQKWSKLLIKASFTGGMSIFIILGMFIGILFSKKKIDEEFNSKEEMVIDWDTGSYITRLIRLAFLLIGFSPVGIIFLLNYLFDISYILFYIFSPILFSLGGFFTFGPCLFYGFKFILSKYGVDQVYSFKDKENDESKIIDSSNEVFN